jgi:6-phosphofructokinase 1
MAAMGTENKGGEKKLGGIGQHVTDVLAKLNDREVRCCVLGHLQRGGDPTTLDRLLGSRFGVEAVNIIAEKKFGYMVSYQNYHVGSVPIQEAVGHLKRVNPKDQIVQTALALGVSFGN